MAVTAALTTIATAQDLTLEIDALRMEAGHLRIDFHADSLLTVRLLANMRRGVTSATRFRVQLWRKRSWLLSGVVAERAFEIKATFDPWEQQFLLQTPDERRLTRSLDYVKDRWQQHRGLSLADSSQLHPKHRYYVVVEASLEPVSRESLQEIRGWLAGEMKSITKRDSANASPPDGNRDFQDRVLDTVLDLTGLGEKAVSIRSEFFRVHENGTIVFER
ncbi:MAG: DUF4390 domain-containing protein [bacterium]